MSLDIDAFRLNDYNFLHRLEGGMGFVFKAENQRTGSISAVKVLKPAYAGLPDYVERIHREIEVLKSLSHPGIVKLLDEHCLNIPGPHNDWHYLQLEWIEGITLEGVLDSYKLSGRQVSISEATSLIVPLCEALSYAHNITGDPVIHRDIKPSNIILREGDFSRPVLTDFGIVYLRGARKLTQQFNIVGAAEYMSPEHASSEKLDSRSDIYSLGIVLYELVTGEVPFPDLDGSPIGVLASHIQKKPVPPSVCRRDLPAWLEHIILKSLHKRPEDRFLDAMEIVRIVDSERVDSGLPTHEIGLSTKQFEDEELRKILEGHRGYLGTDELVLPPKDSSMMAILLTAIMLLVLFAGGGGLLAWVYWRNTQFDKYCNNARDSYYRGQMEYAYGSVTKALRIKPKSRRCRKLKGDILSGMLDKLKQSVRRDLLKGSNERVVEGRIRKIKTLGIETGNSSARDWCEWVSSVIKEDALLQNYGFSDTWKKKTIRLGTHPLKEQEEILWKYYQGKWRTVLRQNIEKALRDKNYDRAVAIFLYINDSTNLPLAMDNEYATKLFNAIEAKALASDIRSCRRYIDLLGKLNVYSDRLDRLKTQLGNIEKTIREARRGGEYSVIISNLLSLLTTESAQWRKPIEGELKLCVEKWQTEWQRKIQKALSDNRIEDADEILYKVTNLNDKLPKAVSVAKSIRESRQLLGVVTEKVDTIKNAKVAAQDYGPKKALAILVAFKSQNQRCPSIYMKDVLALCVSYLHEWVMKSKKEASELIGKGLHDEALSVLSKFKDVELSVPDRQAIVDLENEIRSKQSNYKALVTAIKNHYSKQEYDKVVDLAAKLPGYHSYDLGLIIRESKRIIAEYIRYISAGRRYPVLVDKLREYKKAQAVWDTADVRKLIEDCIARIKEEKAKQTKVNIDRLITAIEGHYSKQEYDKVVDIAAQLKTSDYSDDLGSKIRESKRKIAAYNGYITAGDKCLKLVDELKEYEKAQAVWNTVDVRERISKCNRLIKGRESKKIIDEYNRLISAGDKCTKLVDKLKEYKKAQAVWDTADVRKLIKKCKDDIEREFLGRLIAAIEGHYSNQEYDKVVELAAQLKTSDYSSDLGFKISKSKKIIAAYNGYISAGDKCTKLADKLKEYEKAKAEWNTDNIKGLIKDCREELQKRISPTPIAWKDTKVRNVDVINSDGRVARKKISYYYDKYGIGYVFVPAGRLKYNWDGKFLDKEIKGFYISATEITVAQKKRILKEVIEGRLLKEENAAGEISFENAKHLIDSMGSIATDGKTACSYNLPSKYQWLRASLGGANKKYHCGDILSNQIARFSRSNESDEKTQVKSFPANCYGVYDMLGNMWEWTSEVADDGNHLLIGGSFMETIDDIKEIPHSLTSKCDGDYPYGLRVVINVQKNKDSN